ncbi:tRNA pseudouridine(55) synthase TruB [Clostridium intestinale]|uniref:tRNA pseudouridine synthase B n=1 Tax=Clostridium intestinale URNW TaxID=1294142 RepID=U2Q4N9_9CLOT|nr:tRNA pseudouridine(55) synthase TruB [Clostridium intestinale]ERK31064.1 tRNA pseudouridine synthase B [Clostridium intestinale URNW]
MNGVLIVNKPKGITSFQVVSKVRKIVGVKKVGHTGTLDPLATGVLPICIGKATKIIDYIMEGKKGYSVSFELGKVTDTYDSEGKIIDEKSIIGIDENRVLEVIGSFKGPIMQEPPMYSALKQNGKRLYELARKGIEVERKKRPVTIYSIENIQISLPKISMDVVCSKGTYIRSLCYDIGKELEVGAFMTELKRTLSSPFSIDDAINYDDLEKVIIENNLMAMDRTLDFYDKIIIENGYEKLLLNGVKVSDKRFCKTRVEEDKLFRVYTSEEILIGIGKMDSCGFKLEKNLM